MATLLVTPTLMQQIVLQQKLVSNYKYVFSQLLVWIELSFMELQEHMIQVEYSKMAR